MAPSTPSDSHRALWRLSACQHGVVTHEQLVTHGLGPEGIRHRCAIGRLHRIYRGVYAVGRPQLSREGRWLAATLACGPSSALSHASAAALWGIRTPRAALPIEISAPRRTDRRQPGVRFHRVVMSAADLTCRDGVPVVSPARTLLNQAATSSRGRLEADINAADIHGLITPGALRRSLDGFRGQPGVTALRGLLDQHTFTLTHSELERLFIPIARSAGLPKPRTQAWVNGFRVDFFWPELGLVAETDGLRYHRTPAQQAKDLVRDQTHKAAGLEPLRFTHWQVAYDKRWVRATLCRVTERIRRS